MSQIEQGTEVYPGIEVHSAIMGGTPVITGTRVPVSVILGHLASGDTAEAVAAEYDLTDGQVRAALDYAAENVSSLISLQDI